MEATKHSHLQLAQHTMFYQYIGPLVHGTLGLKRGSSFSDKYHLHLRMSSREVEEEERRTEGNR